MRAHDHGALVRELEVLDRVAGVARHAEEELLAPARHAVVVGLRQRDPGDVVGQAVEVDLALELAPIRVNVLVSGVVDTYPVTELTSLAEFKNPNGAPKASRLPPA